MNLVANRRLRVRPNQILHIRRSLEGLGKITVSVGTEVKPEDIVGEAIVQSGFTQVKLAVLLGVSNEEAIQYLVKKINSKIYKGELLAQKKGLFGERHVLAPTDGILSSYDKGKGYLMLKHLPKKSPLVAGVYGIVDGVTAEGDVLIRSCATQILGMMGVGKERSGILNVVGSASDLVNSAHIKRMFSHHLVVVGALIYGDTLKEVAGKGIGGIISGGLNARDFKAMTGSFNPVVQHNVDPGLTVLVTEGFGAIPIGSDIFNLLKSHHSQFALVSGHSSSILLPSTSTDSIMAVRKERIPISLASTIKGAKIEDVGLENLKVGNKVRVIWPPFAGWQGTVESIDATQTKIDSGIQTFVVTASSGMRKLRIPYPNLEIIE